MTNIHQTAPVIEIVGPAGAGKTTLTSALKQGSQAIKGSVRLRQLQYTPLFVQNALLALPTVLQKPQDKRWFTQQELRLMVYLKVLHQVVERETRAGSAAIVLDQGPVYKLAELHGFDVSLRLRPLFAHWWERMLHQWAATLTVIVRLDADDAILVKRIQTRGKWHQLKAESEERAGQRLTQYRAAFDQVITKLTANGGPQVFRFATDQEALEQIVAQVLTSFTHKQA